MTIVETFVHKLMAGLHVMTDVHWQAGYVNTSFCMFLQKIRKIAQKGTANRPALPLFQASGFYLPLKDPELLRYISEPVNIKIEMKKHTAKKRPLNNCSG